MNKRTTRIEKETDTRTKLILAAIEDIREHGVTDLSLRRVALKCGMTSGAPYRHFADKNELFIAVFNYANEAWHKIAEKVAFDSSLSVREKIEELCMSYIRFLCDHPGFQSILTINDSSMTEDQRAAKSRISQIAELLISIYSNSVGMDEKTKIRKMFLIRSLIYTSALMINSGTMPYNDETLSMVHSLISREFDID